MKTTIGLLGLCVGVAVSSGCSPNDLNGVSDQDIAAQWLNSAVDNSASVNGISKNGISKNGISKNGISKNGVSYSGIGYTGTSMKATPSDQGVEVDGTALTGINR